MKVYRQQSYAVVLTSTYQRLLLAKLEQLGERPIEVSVTTLLDRRQVARSVYRDLRERKIKNYETL